MSALGAEIARLLCEAERGSRVVAGFEETIRLFGPGSYERAKRSGAGRKYREIKATVTTALGGWTPNSGDEVWSFQEKT